MSCLIKNLDNGEEFLVNEMRKDGDWEKIKEMGIGTVDHRWVFIQYVCRDFANHIGNDLGIMD